MGGHNCALVEFGGVERREAEAIYDAGREVVVEVLLRMDRQIQQLTARVERLERELAKNSRNSSRPPSQDRPKTAAAGRRAGRVASRAGSPGMRATAGSCCRPGRWMRWLCTGRRRVGVGMCSASAERVAVGEPVAPSGRGAAARSRPWWSSISASGCAARIAAPSERASCRPRSLASAFGPRLQAAVATLSVRNRVSRRDAVELSERAVRRADLSTGTVDAILARAGDALELTPTTICSRASRRAGRREHGRDRLAAERRAADAVGRVHRASIAVYRIADNRHEDHARELLGDSSAIVTSDRWWAYNHLPLARRQICWSHLQRDFQAHAEGIGAEHELGEHRPADLR